VLGVTLCGVAVIGHSLLEVAIHPVAPEWLVLVVATVVSVRATLTIPGMPISFSISDTFTIAAGLLFGPAPGAVNAALDGLLVSTRIPSSQRSWRRILFNMATPALAVWLASTLFFAVEGGTRQPESAGDALHLLATLILTGTIIFALNSGIVAAAVSFERGMPILAIWRAHMAGVWITYFAGIFGTMVLLLIGRTSTLNILLVMLPLPVILYVTFRHAIGRASDQIDHLAKVNRVYVGAIEALAHAVDAKDEVTHDHTRRVQDQAVRLARALGVTDDTEIQALKAASLLHDVGKLAVPEHILNKPGRLTPAEFEVMKRHAAIGAEILSVIGLPFAVAPIVRHHHENWDGSGYPDGLAASRIPIGARILAVVDCFDALTSDRPYRPRLDDSQALDILRERRGTMYDPGVVDAFLALQGQATAEVPRPSASLCEAVAKAPVTEHSRGPIFGNEDLARLSESLGSPGSPSELGAVLWKHIEPRVPAASFVFYTYDETTNALVPVFRGGRDAAYFVKARMEIGERLSGWVAATGEIVLNSDARLDLSETLRSECPLRSALAMPVTLGNRVIAVLSLYSRAPNAFDERHMHLGRAAACVASQHLVAVYH
jgi:putative nucleotidyltransferase with HDIG domain